MIFSPHISGDFMFIRKKLIPLITCICLLLSGFGAEELISIASEFAADKTVHSDWKAYYSDIIGGNLPAELNTALEKRMMPKTLSSFKDYFLCDWDNDGTPELFLEAIQTRYVFVIGADESVMCADIFGINPKASALVAKGVEDLTTDPGMDEWSVYIPKTDEPVYFNRGSDGLYTVYDCSGGDKVTASSSEKAEALYRQLFKKYIPETVPLKYISVCPINDLSGLSNVVKPDYSLLAERSAACEAFREFCDKERYYDFPIEFFNEVTIRKTFFDFEQDGIPELILTNASGDSAKVSAFVFEYADGEIKLLGKGPECCYYTDCIRNILLGFAGNVWTLYTKDGAKFNSKLLETGHQYLPTSNDDIYMVKGFTIQELPYATLEMSFYRA